MGYSGRQYFIPCNRGGLTYNPNNDLIRAVDMIPPTRNINLHENGRKKRGGTAHVDDAAISGAPQYMGIFDFILVGGTQHIIRACNDGKVYRDNVNTIKASGMSKTRFFDFEVFADELYIVDGASTPEKWTGSGNTSTLTDIPTDWSGSDNPQWVVKHGRGNSERMWYGGVPATPHRIYASVNGDGDDISDANNITLSIETGDGFGIVGAVEFGDRLIGFGKTKAYIIDDLDSDTSYWGYDAAQWEGGVCNFRCIVKTPNDVICMMEDGEIYSVLAAQQYGDYKAASLTRPAFMHRWIKEFVKLSAFDQFHGVYDKTLRAIKFFVVRKGSTDVDTALVYFIDRPLNEAWMVHGNWAYNSGYSSSASAQVRVSAGNHKVYTGDYTGNLWTLEESNVSDNFKGYYSGFKSGNLAFENPRATKKYKRGWMSTKTEGAYELNVAWWVDGSEGEPRSIDLTGAGGVLGLFTLGVSLLGGDELIDTPFNLGDRGKRIQLEVFNSNADEDFFVSQILIDYKWLGGRPA